MFGGGWSCVIGINRNYGIHFYFNTYYFTYDLCEYRMILFAKPQLLRISPQLQLILFLILSYIFLCGLEQIYRSLTNLASKKP